MPFASSSTINSLRGRSVPFLTASALSLTLYTVHNHYSPLLAEEKLEILLTPASSKLKLPSPAEASPFTPLGWGTNKYLTLWPEPSASTLKRPTPLAHLGSSPLRDLVIAEKYGACVDANGDCWMWGAGYDPSGEGIAKLIPTPGKVVAVSANGKVYVVSASKAFQDSKHYQAERSWWNKLFGTNPGVDFIELKAEGGLKRGERWASVDAGLHHVLAVTNKGRTFSLPLTPSANSHRQLGTRQVFEQPNPVASSSASAIPLSPNLPPSSDIRFATKFTPIPSLQGLNVAQVAASDRTSFVRMANGKVLGWGANESAQIGLGGNVNVDTVNVPVEIILARSYPPGTSLTCLDVVANGQTTFFLTERLAPGKEPVNDLLAAGNGMSGSLGNGLWSSACGTPTRVKTVSGLQEYSESAKAFLPIGYHNLSLSPSPSAHVFVTLDTVSQAEKKGVEQGHYGKDVMVWGGNVDYQLGNGKRSSLAIPQHLPALFNAIRGPKEDALRKEATLSSGTISPMPHSRLQLHQGKAHAYDPTGKLIKKNVRCEETVVAGWNASVLYNQIIS